MALDRSKFNTDRLMNGMLSAYHNTPGRNGVGTDPMGAFAAFMGIPNQAARANYGTGAYNTGGPGSPYGGGGGGNGGGGGGTGNPNDPDAQMKKVGLPQWWIDWLHTSGQYGGVPPAGGLLD